MNLFEYLGAVNEMMWEMEDNNVPGEALDDLALTLYSVAIQMGWEIRLEYV